MPHVAVGFDQRDGRRAVQRQQHLRHVGLRGHGRAHHHLLGVDAVDHGGHLLHRVGGGRGRGLAVGQGLAHRRHHGGVHRGHVGQRGQLLQRHAGQRLALRRRRLRGGDAAGDEAVGRVRAGGVCRRVGDLRAFGQHGLQRRRPGVAELGSQQAAPLQAVDVFGNGPAEQVDQLGIGPHAVAQHHHLALAQAQQITLQQRSPAFFGLDVNHGIGLTPRMGAGLSPPTLTPRLRRREWSIRTPAKRRIVDDPGAFSRLIPVRPAPARRARAACAAPAATSPGPAMRAPERRTIPWPGGRRAVRWP